MINRIKGRSNTSTIKHLTVNNNIITDKAEIANALAEQMSYNSSSELCSDNFLKHKLLSEKKKINFSSSNDEYYNREFSHEELKSSLNRAHDTAEGPDKIHYQLLKHLPPESMPLLLNIYNYIWQSGEFPDCWSEATVIPIPKPGKDHNVPNNYRPIALTSCVCKTLERMISKIEKVPRGIRGEKSSKDMASSRNLVSTIGALASPKMGDGTRCPEG